MNQGFIKVAAGTPGLQLQIAGQIQKQFWK